ncbi:MAG TPA: hypothetical protein VF755_11140 [Catenuloplanes sp.]|jgi:hypothetical protein
MNDNPSPQPARNPDGAAAAVQLRRLRRLIRQQLAGAVTEERLDIDLANGILDTVGLPNLQRIWTVRIGLPFVCEVSAASHDDAFDAAEDQIEAALTNAGIPMDVDWERRERDEATPGLIDHHGLAADDDTNDRPAPPVEDPPGSGRFDAPDAPHPERSGLPFVVELEYPSSGERSLYGPVPHIDAAQGLATRLRDKVTNPDGDADADAAPIVSTVVINPPSLDHLIP